MDLLYFLVPVVVAVAFFGESIFGFGGGLIAIPLLSVFLGVQDAVTLVLIFQFLIGVLLWKSYKYINWRTAKPMAIAMIFGTIAGTLLLSSASAVFLQVFLATAILLFLTKMVWFNGFTFGSKPSTAGSLTAGLGGGLFQGAIGTGGPVLTMYLSVVVKEKTSLRATLIYLFCVTGLVRIAISIPNNLFTQDIIRLALITLPAFLLAIIVGQRLYNKVSDYYYRLSIYIILAGSAIVLLYKALS
jgi:uncharacterized membrane protein YfcA